VGELPIAERVVPFFRVQIEVFDFAMLKELGQANAIVGNMWLLSNDGYVVLSPFRIQLGQLLSVTGSVRHWKPNTTHSRYNQQRT
jgi:hypothetical protein